MIYHSMMSYAGIKSLIHKQTLHMIECIMTKDTLILTLQHISHPQQSFVICHFNWNGVSFNCDLCDYFQGFSRQVEVARQSNFA